MRRKEPGHERCRVAVGLGDGDGDVRELLTVGLPGVLVATRSGAFDVGRGALTAAASGPAASPGPASTAGPAIIPGTAADCDHQEPTKQRTRSDIGAADRTAPPLKLGTASARRRLS